MICMWKMNKHMLMVDDMTRKRMEEKKSKKEEGRPETIRIYIYIYSNQASKQALQLFNTEDQYNIACISQQQQ
jgi:metal-responsive CopG/Arc/MetJ family transcriptional regulator